MRTINGAANKDIAKEYAFSFEAETAFWKMLLFVAAMGDKVKVSHLYGKKRKI